MMLTLIGGGVEYFSTKAGIILSEKPIKNLVRKAVVLKPQRIDKSSNG